MNTYLSPEQQRNLNVILNVALPSIRDDFERKEMTWPDPRLSEKAWIGKNRSAGTKR